MKLLGGLDYLINNAGAPGTRTPIPPADLEALTDDFWDRMLRINLLSAFWMTKTLAGALRDRARRGGQHGVGFGFRRRREQYRLCDRQGGTGRIDAGTGAGTRAGTCGSTGSRRVSELQLGMLVRRLGGAGAGEVPLARVGQPEEYAELIVYLCAGASYITGEVICVSGGARL